MKYSVVTVLFVTLAGFTAQADFFNENEESSSSLSLPSALPEINKKLYRFFKFEKATEGEEVKPFDLGGRWLCNRVVQDTVNDTVNVTDECNCECLALDDGEDCENCKVVVWRNPSNASDTATGRSSSRCNKTDDTNEGTAAPAEEMDCSTDNGKLQLPGECKNCSEKCTDGGISLETCICDCVNENCSNCRNVEDNVIDLVEGPFERVIGNVDGNVMVDVLGGFCFDCRRRCVTGGFVVQNCNCVCLFRNCNCRVVEDSETEDVNLEREVFFKLDGPYDAFMYKTMKLLMDRSGKGSYDAPATRVLVWAENKTTTTRSQ